LGPLRLGAAETAVRVGMGAGVLQRDGEEANPSDAVKQEAVSAATTLALGRLFYQLSLPNLAHFRPLLCLLKDAAS